MYNSPYSAHFVVDENGEAKYLSFGYEVKFNSSDHTTPKGITDHPSFPGIRYEELKAIKDELMRAYGNIYIVDAAMNVLAELVKPEDDYFDLADYIDHRIRRHRIYRDTYSRMLSPTHKLRKCHARKRVKLLRKYRGR